MRTPGERAEGVVALCSATHCDDPKDGERLLTLWVANALREHEEDLLRFGARGCPVKPERLEKALARVRECMPFTSAEVEAVIRHLGAQVALLAHEQDYRQGYDEGRREGWRACREAVLACLSRGCVSHVRVVLKRLVETEVPKECP